MQFLPQARRLRRTGAVLLGAGALVATGVSSAAAPVEHLQGAGYVTRLSDGDTPYVDVYGDGTSQDKGVRLIGVQTTETMHFGAGTNWCHSVKATEALGSMVLHKQVQLRSMYANSTNGDRPLRSVFYPYKRADGSTAYANVQEKLIQRGHGMWFPQTVEWRHNLYYHQLQNQAVAAGRNIWDKTFCGSGPHQQAKLKVMVRWDANGADDKNRNGEYVIIRNDNATQGVPLGGWHVRDTSTKVFTFPSQARVPAGGEVRVHVGNGTNVNSGTRRDFYWNLSKSLFGNVDWSRSFGDGAYLLDPDGDFRAWSTYPCIPRGQCYDPLKYHLRISHVQYDVPGYDQPNDEYVVLKSVNTSKRQYIGRYMVRSWPWTYLIPRHTYLDPGQTLTIRIGKGTSTRRLKYWGESTDILDNRGDEVDVSTLKDIQIACYSWGGVSCAY